MDSLVQLESDSLKLWIVALLLMKHWICDFVLQTQYQLRFKRIYGHPGGLLHAAIHAVATGGILSLFPVSWAFVGLAMLGEFVFHYHVDWLKEQAVNRIEAPAGAGFWALFGFDQLLHQLTYVAIAALA